MDEGKYSRAIKPMKPHQNTDSKTSLLLGLQLKQQPHLQAIRHKAWILDYSETDSNIGRVCGYHGYSI